MDIDLKSIIHAHNRAIENVLHLEKCILDAIQALKDTFANGGRVFICGNGGSASDAQHFSAELTGRYLKDRRALPAIALTTDTSALTSIGNDFGFDCIFSRQLQGLATKSDLLIAISTSGNSQNIIRAVDVARENKLTTIGLLGRDGGKLNSLVDIALTVQAENTARIQEAHILILHSFCEAFEES